MNEDLQAAVIDKLTKTCTCKSINRMAVKKAIANKFHTFFIPRAQPTAITIQPSPDPIFPLRLTAITQRSSPGKIPHQLSKVSVPTL